MKWFSCRIILPSERSQWIEATDWNINQQNSWVRSSKSTYVSHFQIYSTGIEEKWQIALSQLITPINKIRCHCITSAGNGRIPVPKCAVVLIALLNLQVSNLFHDGTCYNRLLSLKASRMLPTHLTQRGKMNQQEETFNRADQQD